jgi:hypothetical protein
VTASLESVAALADEIRAAGATALDVHAEWGGRTLIATVGVHDIADWPLRYLVLDAAARIEDRYGFSVVCLFRERDQDAARVTASTTPRDRARTGQRRAIPGDYSPAGAGPPRRLGELNQRRYRGAVDPATKPNGGMQ